MVAIVSCLTLLRQVMRLARSLALASAGNNKAARMAMIAMTTSSSMRVKPRSCRIQADRTADVLARSDARTRGAGRNLADPKRQGSGTRLFAKAFMLSP